jgi:ABC-type uncharacterized transport system ATPase subunit
MSVLLGRSVFQRIRILLWLAVTKPGVPAFKPRIQTQEGTMHAVELSNVSRFYGQRAAVREATFPVPREALFGLLGPNGAGKSTCLGMVTTLLPPSAGSSRSAAWT